MLLWAGVTASNQGESKMKSRTTLSALTAIGATLATVGAAAADAGPSYGWSGEHPMMWSGMFMGPVMMILMVVIIVVIIFKFFQCVFEFSKSVS